MIADLTLACQLLINDLSDDQHFDLFLLTSCHFLVIVPGRASMTSE